MPSIQTISRFVFAIRVITLRQKTRLPACLTRILHAKLSLAAIWGIVRLTRLPIPPFVSAIQVTTLRISPIRQPVFQMPIPLAKMSPVVIMVTVRYRVVLPLFVSAIRTITWKPAIRVRKMMIPHAKTSPAVQTQRF